MRHMAKFESFEDFNRESIENIKDYFIELEDAGDIVDVIATSFDFQYKVSIRSISSDIEDRINWKRIESKYTVYWKRLCRLKVRGRSNMLEMMLIEKVS